MPRYALLDGTHVALGELAPEGREFVRTLQRMAEKGTDYFEVERIAIGPGSPALAGRNRVDNRIVSSDLYRVARDIAKRVGIEQGLILAPEFEAQRGELLTDGSMISATQAANWLGISRAAVHKAFNEGRLDGGKIGNLVLISKEGCRAFQAARGSGGAQAQKGQTRRVDKRPSSEPLVREALAATTRHK